MFELKLIILFSLLLHYSYSIKAESECGDWEAFNNKCFKLFENNGLQTYEDALKMCSKHSNDSSLVTITSDEEQRFLTTLIFITKEVVDNVWIGAKFTNSQYKWLNGMNLTFTNWAEGHPKNLTENCVQMHSDPESMGKWVDEFCIRKNLVLCEKLPVWSETYYHETVLNLLESVSKLEKGYQITISSLIQNEILMKETIEKLKQNESTLQETIKILSEKVVKLEKNESNVQLTVNSLKQNEGNLEQAVSNLSLKVSNIEENEITLNETIVQLKQNETTLQDLVNNLKRSEDNLQVTLAKLNNKTENTLNSVVPIGFIYVQFPREKTPQEIWSSMTWQDITSSYAGLFFRAFGGNSSSFGWTQEANSPNIDEVRLYYYINKITDVTKSYKDLKADEYLWPFTPTGAICDFKFTVSSGEVRPRNTAIRIWKRYA